MKGVVNSVDVDAFRQVLGTSLTCEPTNPADGTKIDFMATFPESTIGVEATSPLFDTEMDETRKYHNPLLDTIEDLVPGLWAVAVDQLPNLGPADSKRKFKAMVREMLNVPTPEQVATACYVSSSRLCRSLPEVCSKRAKDHSKWAEVLESGGDSYSVPRGIHLLLGSKVNKCKRKDQGC